MFIHLQTINSVFQVPKRKTWDNSRIERSFANNHSFLFLLLYFVDNKNLSLKFDCEDPFLVFSSSFFIRLNGTRLTCVDFPRFQFFFVCTKGFDLFHLQRAGCFCRFCSSNNFTNQRATQMLFICFHWNWEIFDCGIISLTCCTSNIKLYRLITDKRIFDFNLILYSLCIAFTQICGAFTIIDLALLPLTIKGVWSVIRAIGIKESLIRREMMMVVVQRGKKLVIEHKRLLPLIKRTSEARKRTWGMKKMCVLDSHWLLISHRLVILPPSTRTLRVICGEIHNFSDRRRQHRGWWWMLAVRVLGEFCARESTAADFEWTTLSQSGSIQHNSIHTPFFLPSQQHIPLAVSFMPGLDGTFYTFSNIFLVIHFEDQLFFDLVQTVLYSNC